MLAIFVLSSLTFNGFAQQKRDIRRFNIVGSGFLKIRSTKNNDTFSGYYFKNGRYRQDALRKINKVYGASYGKKGMQMSLRLVELLSHLQSKLNKGWITISSGYRSPTYNQRIRKKGGTVALSSLHQYGMACDIKIQGVKSKKLAQFMKKRKLGGVGYYGSPWVHIDVGYPRSWGQKTANVRKGRSIHNKLVYMITWFDRYYSGETIDLRFVRMTAFPIGVQAEFELEKRQNERWIKVLKLKPFERKEETSKMCGNYSSIADIANFSFTIPTSLPPGIYRFRSYFCKRKWPDMKSESISREFELILASKKETKTPNIQ